MRRILLSGFFFFSLFSLFGNPSGLEKIPKQDQKTLTLFFKTLLSQGNFAATLFGCKASSCFDYPPPIVSMIGDPLVKNRFIYELQGWRLWEKYRSLFKIDRFSFIQLKDEYPSILFVHKEKLLSVMARHQDAIRQYLPLDPVSVGIESFLVQAFLPKFHSKDFHFVQGILLGYEPQSCLEFQNRIKIEGTLSYFPYDVEEDIRLHSLRTDELLDGCPLNLVEKAAEYKEKFSMKKSWPDTNPFFCTSSPANMAFEERFISHFDEVKERIAKLFNSDHFLEDFIAVLTE